jgi:hypothetical protein
MTSPPARSAGAIGPLSSARLRASASLLKLWLAGRVLNRLYANQFEPT